VKKSSTFLQLAQTYKQLMASFGDFAMDTLKASSAALASNSSGDATYTSIESQIASLTGQRDALSSQIKALLDGAEFGGQVLNSQQANQLTAQAQSLINQAAALAASS
jgi:hypothetical protein